MNERSTTRSSIAKSLLLACFTCAVTLAKVQPVSAQIEDKPNLPAKKIIEFGWDQVYGAKPEYIRDNIRKIEERPFDGIVFCISDPDDNEDIGGRVFNTKKWDEEKLKPKLKVLEDIKWDKFTDNFLSMFAASSMDWFSDKDWDIVTRHAKFMALAAKTAKCKGLMFDPESYGKSPWRYHAQAHKDTKSFDEYSQMARKRGKQFMQALISEMPEMKLLMFYQYSLFVTYVSSDVDPQKRKHVQSENEYGLLAPFLDGMLEASTSTVQFIDGNEFSYYYRSPLEFYRSHHTVRQEAKIYVAPELRTKFESQVKAGQALYLDWIFNFNPEVHKTNVAIIMSPAERLRWFEHNVYYALKTSDEYVWMYSEHMNWWDNQLKRGTDQTPELKQQILQALLSAKGKVERGEPLGFELGADMKAVTAKE
jgi:hypothetical protein